jgi:hypothetical protein
MASHLSHNSRAQITTIYELCNTPLSSIDKDNSTLNCTSSSTTNALSLTSSPVERMLPSIIPNPLPTDCLVGARAYVRARAAHATAIAFAAAHDAVAVDTAHTMLLEKICTIFLQRALGINPNSISIEDQALLSEQAKKYQSVKTVEQYQDMIWCLSNWGDDE